MNNLFVGNVVKYTNMDGDIKLAIVVEKITGSNYNVITFSGRPIRLHCDDVTNLCARTLDEYLAIVSSH